MHLLLRNSRVISPSQNINGKFDILIVNGVINRMGVVWQHVREVMQYDMSGKVIVPGLFDMHVHFREPGQTHKEDIMTGSLAAAYGGFTGVLCMPNTDPAVDSTGVLDENYRKAKGNIVSVYSAACASLGRKGQKLTDIRSLKEHGALAITDDGNPIADEQLMKETLTEAAKFNLPVIQHCEMTNSSGPGIVNEGAISRKLGIKGIPNSSEYEIIRRDIELVHKVKNACYHVQHISTKEGVELVRTAKRDGIEITAEACPHHFILTDEAVEKYGPNAKMNPPLRTKEDVNSILEGLRDGTIDAVCTDHAPHSAEEKSQTLEQAPFGIVGLETAVGLAYTYLVERNVISLEDLIVKMSVNPRRILNLPEIKIQEGELADLTILDVESEWVVDTARMHSKSRNSPFDGWKLKGRPAGIINNCQHLIYG